MNPRLYLFVIVAVDEQTKTNYIVPHLYIADLPQTAANKGLEAIKEMHPNCRYELGVVHEVPASIIADIKQLM